jgi:hypothetical protein
MLALSLNSMRDCLHQLADDRTHVGRWSALASFWRASSSRDRRNASDCTSGAARLLDIQAAAGETIAGSSHGVEECVSAPGVAADAAGEAGARLPGCRGARRLRFLDLAVGRTRHPRNAVDFAVGRPRSCCQGGPTSIAPADGPWQTTTLRHPQPALDGRFDCVQRRRCMAMDNAAKESPCGVRRCGREPMHRGARENTEDAREALGRFRGLRRTGPRRR